MIDDGTGLLTIGELARSTGLTVRTIRYWSDEGVLTPVTRSAGGYRLYDAESAARLELIRTLRELGLGLDDVRKVLAGETTIAEVAAAHVVALDAQIRALRVTRAVLSTVARRGSTAEEMTFMNKLARLSAAERRRIMGSSWRSCSTVSTRWIRASRSGCGPWRGSSGRPDARTGRRLGGVGGDGAGPGVPGADAQGRRVQRLGPGARRRTGAVHLVPHAAGAAGRGGQGAGVDPGSPEAEGILREVLGEGGDPAVVLERMVSASNDRLARYRELLATVKGGGPAAAHREEFAWVVAALRARLAG